MALHLARPRHRSLANPPLIRLFSTDPPSQNDAESPETTPSPSSSFSSYFSDVKASLKQKNQQQQQSGPKPFSGPVNPPSFSFSNNQSSGKVASLEQIRQNLAEFRRRSNDRLPTGDSASPQPHVSFQELYKRNVIAKSGENPSAAAATDATRARKGGNMSFEAIRESLRQMRSAAPGNVERKGQPPPPSFSAFKDSLKMRPNDDVKSTVIGGTEALPISVFGKEMKDRGKGESENAAGKTDFVKMYTHGELGAKLQMLRPEGKRVEGWFSVKEMNERLMKLREMEEKETDSKIGGMPFKDLRAGLEGLRKTEEDNKRKTSLHRLDILGHLGGSPPYLLHPPKEHLVEAYFHPDNLSSAEKMKAELAKVREEFKMNESDCGSARVQVAQLTTKIKHLSSVLHKKDKHSRKGLLAMVQMRKKLLKYLRRTDWDSYCLVLSKLGLRDNPDYKN